MQCTRLVLLVDALSLVACASGGPSPRPCAPRTGAEHIEVARAGSQRATSGAAANFTGRVVVTPLFQANEHTRAGGASVSFEPGARTAWHTHPAGQTLIVLAGTGWVQEWGGLKHTIRAGDVVWTPPGVKHWHEDEGGRSRAVSCDVARGDAVTWALDEAIDAFGRLDFASTTQVSNRGNSPNGGAR